MSKRNSDYKRKRRDAYPTPVGPLDALLSAVAIPRCRVWECAAGKKAHPLAEQLRKRGYIVHVSDIGNGGDFLDFKKPIDKRVGAIITNPPFGKLGAEFIEHGLSLLPTMAPPQMMCLLFPTDYDHAARRQHLFNDGMFLGEVKLTKRIVWFRRRGTIAAPSEWHSWFVWRCSVNFIDPFVRYAGWQ